ncbi:MAG TPA: hypothetical protein VIH75_02360 [Candidatus Sulfotelmatobacter sp.]|jgi:hypothetical protein
MNDIRPEDKDVFAAAALEIGVYILVRGTNEASLKYISDPLCVPKPIDCKAKTADQGPLAGLVVDPRENGSAFSSKRRAKADEWIRTLSPRYTVVKDAASPYHGCVQLGGKRVHGDYDLKGIVLPGQEQRILTLVTETLGQDARRGPKFYAVQEFVNDAIGKPMVQHGAEDEYLDHSTDQDETIFVFFPEEREPKLLRGPAETRAWYQKELKGRSPLIHDAAPTAVPPPGAAPIRGVISSDAIFRPVDVSQIRRRTKRRPNP